MPHLAVYDRRVSALCVTAHVLPHVQHRAAGGVDERAPAALELLKHRHRHAKCRKNHDVVGLEALDRPRRIAEEAHAHGPQLIVDVGVVDDFAGQIDRPIRKPPARLVGVVHGAIDPVTEAEFARQMDREAPGAVGEVVGLDLLDEGAVVALREHAGDGMLEIQALFGRSAKKTS